MSASPARRELARLVEYTLRTADATRADLERLCAEARSRGFASVCVNGSRVSQAVHFLDETDVKVTCAVAFPLGASDADVKRYETEAAIDSGAQFIELVPNIGRLKEGDRAYLLRELRDVVEAADERPVSVYLDLGLLTIDELRGFTSQAVEAAAKGIAIAGGRDVAARLEAVKVMREIAGEALGVKVDQTNFSLDEIIALLNAGATRFGTSQTLEF